MEYKFKVFSKSSNEEFDVLELIFKDNLIIAKIDFIHYKTYCEIDNKTYFLMEYTGLSNYFNK